MKADYYTLIAFAASFSFSVWASIHALLNKEYSRAAFSWIVVCWVLPYIGALMYLWFGNDRVRKRAAKLAGSVVQPAARPVVRLGADGLQPQHLHLKPLSRITQSISQFAIESGNSIEPLFEGDAVYDRMLQAIHAARHHVYLATYIFNYDTVGKRFVQALEDAHQRGVQVYVLIDGVGEWYSLKRVGNELIKRGVCMARFYPPRLIPPGLYINIRNHRKLLIVDHEIGFVGGMNIYKKHSAHCSSPYNAIRDIHFEVRGPLVAQLARVFADDWALATDEELKLPEIDSLPMQGTLCCRTIIDGPDESIDSLLFVLMAAVNSAQYSLEIVTPYFIVHEELMRVLQIAALRGVDIKIILPDKSNLRPVDWAARHTLGKLLERGISIYLQPAPFDHSKMLLVDRHYALIGSANIDPRSIRLNYEILVEVYDDHFAAALGQHVDQLVTNASILDYHTWSQRSLPVKIRDGFFWLFSPYL